MSDMLGPDMQPPTKLQVKRITRARRSGQLSNSQQELAGQVTHEQMESVGNGHLIK